MSNEATVPGSSIRGETRNVKINKLEDTRVSLCLVYGETPIEVEVQVGVEDLLNGLVEAGVLTSIPGPSYSTTR